MKNPLVFLSALIAIACAIMAIWQSDRARLAESHRLALEQERDSLANKLGEAERTKTLLAAENANLRALPANHPQETVRSGARPLEAAQRGRRPPGPMEIMNTPEARRLMAIDQKSRLDQRYAALFRALGLPPDKLEQLKQLLVDKQNAPMDVLSAAHAADLSGDGDAQGAIREMMGQESSALESAIRELLGDTAYEEYRDYERTQPERSLVEQLANRLSYSDTPLTAEQASSLVDLLSAARSTQQTMADPASTPGVRVAVAAGASDSFVSFASSSGTDVPITDESLASASSVLSRSQLEALRQLQADQQARADLGEFLRSSLPAPGPGGARTVRFGP